MILVCGEALVDAVNDPDGGHLMTPGGGPFNTARALARLGVPTAFLGHLSTDAQGRRLAELLASDGVNLELATFGPEPTTLAVAHVDKAGLADYEFVVDGTSAPNLTAAMVPEHLPPDINAIHIGTLGLALEPMTSALTGLLLRECGRRLVMLDPNIRPRLVAGNDGYRDLLTRLMGRSTIVKGSEDDFLWLSPGLTLEAASEDVLRSGAQLVVVTLGPQGATAITHSLHVSVQAPPVDVVDTIGAGDAFSAGFLAWLHDHDRIGVNLDLDAEELRAALESGCLTASLTCAKAGADPPTRAEIERARNLQKAD